MNEDINKHVEPPLINQPWINHILVLLHVLTQVLVEPKRDHESLDSNKEFPPNTTYGAQKEDL